MKYGLEGQYQIRFTLWKWEFIFTIINWKKITPELEKIDKAPRV